MNPLLATPPTFPFTAVVGADPGALDDTRALDPMALALILTAISPDVGGVLVRGEKGTAKSTLVRALAAVLPPIEVVAGDRFSTDPRDPAPLSPDGPFAGDAPTEVRAVRLVELPVGATEDRVLGSLHLERALSEGKAEYEPGLLARAHRGILYVDEVNLLHDHLVDLLLDAAATGRASVERDGVSVQHAARFVLVGTMNPEEGELRPQLLDRFGLSVEVAAPREPALRAEVVRRRIAFDADPVGFAAAHADAEDALRARVAAARDLLPRVELGEAALLRIAEVCAAFEVDGLRADIVTARAAVAHAAWQGRDRVSLDDIRVAATLALPHRRRRQPFDAPGLDDDRLEEALGDDDLEPEPDPEPDGPPPGGGEHPDEHGDEHEGGAHDDPSSDLDPLPTPASPEQDAGADTPTAPAPTLEPARAGQAFRTRARAVPGLGEGAGGRRSRASSSTSGRRVGVQPQRRTDGAVHLVETVRAAAPHQHARGRTGVGRLRLRPEDLRRAVREGTESNLVLFCVDASGSMAARRRMEQVKTAVLSLLTDAYQRRDKVGLVTFRGTGAEVALPPTHSVDAAVRRLDDLPAGGRTPLAEGLLQALQVLDVEARRDPRRRPLLVVVSDARATAGADAIARSHAAAALVADRGIATVVVDCEAGPLRLGLAARLAEHLRAEHLPLAHVDAQALVDVVDSARPGRGRAA